VEVVRELSTSFAKEKNPGLYLVDDIIRPPIMEARNDIGSDQDELRLNF
jgi:hypothetical protein